jgi:hypothetical protein
MYQSSDYSVSHALSLPLQKGTAAGSGAPAPAGPSHTSAPPLAVRTAPLVYTRHFEEALGRVGPSVSRKDQRMYDQIRLRLRSSRGR